MKFCPVKPGSRQCYKFLINYILQLNVESFIPVRQDPSFVGGKRKKPFAIFYFCYIYFEFILSFLLKNYQYTTKFRKFIPAKYKIFFVGVLYGRFGLFWVALGQFRSSFG